MTISDETPFTQDAETVIADQNLYPEQMEKIEEEIREEQPIALEDAALAESRQPQQTLYRAAGFWIRLLAFGIDLAVIAFINTLFWDELFPAGAQQSFIYRIIQTNPLFLGLTGLAYFILMTHTFQQTLGKMITGIQVVQRSGEPLSWSTVIFRELVGRSLSQLMGLNLGYLFCWFNQEKRCLHDLFSDTWVVYVKPDFHPGYITIDGTLA